VKSLNVTRAPPPAQTRSKKVFTSHQLTGQWTKSVDKLGQKNRCLPNRHVGDTPNKCKTRTFLVLETLFCLKDDCYQPLLTARIKASDYDGTKPSDMQVE